MWSEFVFFSVGRGDLSSFAKKILCDGARL